MFLAGRYWLNHGQAIWKRGQVTDYMKFKIDKKYISWGVTAFCVVAASIIFYSLIFRLDGLIRRLGSLYNILAPILFGAVIAYLLNPIMKFLENSVVKFCKWRSLEPREKLGKIMRLACVILSLFFFYACIYALFAMLVPQLMDSIINLINSFPRYAVNIQDWLIQLFRDNPDLENSASGLMETAIEKAESWLNSLLPRLQDFMKLFSSRVFDVLIFLKNVIIGSMISIYFLYGKESFLARGKRLLYACIPKIEVANNILRDLRFVERTFGGFFVGKMIDSVIIGLLCYIGTTILSMPYALLVSVVVGVTNIIPFFGPFIGAIPCALLILLVSPLKCLYFIIFILVLQQCDGNFIGPKILGNSTGLSSFMVVVAILVGSGFFGVVGMIIGVPLFAVISQICSNAIERRLKKHHLPLEIENYDDLNHVDEQTRKPCKEAMQPFDRSQVFRYGVRGNRLSDPDTDDEILPAYIIRKASKRRHQTNIPHLREDSFVEVRKASEFGKIEEDGDSENCGNKE